MRISDWSSDGCSSDLAEAAGRGAGGSRRGLPRGGEGAGTAGRNAGTAHALSGTDSRGGTRRAGRRRRQPENGKASCKEQGFAGRLKCGGGRIIKQKRGVNQHLRI